MLTMVGETGVPVCSHLHIGSDHKDHSVRVCSPRRRLLAQRLEHTRFRHRCRRVSHQLNSLRVVSLYVREA